MKSFIIYSIITTTTEYYWFLLWQINQSLIASVVRANDSTWLYNNNKKKWWKKFLYKKNYNKTNELLCIDYYVLENKIHLRSFLLKNTKKNNCSWVFSFLGDVMRRALKSFFFEIVCFVLLPNVISAVSECTFGIVYMFIFGIFQRKCVAIQQINCHLIIICWPKHEAIKIIRSH